MNCMTTTEYEGLRSNILNVTLDTLSAIDTAFVRDKSYIYALCDAHKELELGLRILEGKIAEYKRHS